MVGPIDRAGRAAGRPGAHRVVEDELRLWAEGRRVPFAVEADGELAGRVTLYDLRRGPWRDAGVEF